MGWHHLVCAEQQDSLNQEGHLLAAQVRATLSLVEQQRIANLIALANMELATVSTEALKRLAYVDNDGLLASEIHGPQPDIAAALGLGVGDE